MAANNQTLGLDLRARSLWLLLGWVLVLSVVFLSVAPISIETGVEQGDKLSHAFAYGTLMVWFANLEKWEMKKGDRHYYRDDSWCVRS